MSNVIAAVTPGSIITRDTFTAANLKAIDTHGILGGEAGAETTGQGLIGALTNKLLTEFVTNTVLMERLGTYVLKSKIVNDFLSTDEETVLSGPMGKLLKEQLNVLNTNLTTLYTTRWTNNVDKITVGPGTVVTTEIAVPTISGYTPIGAIGFSTKQGLSVYQCSIDGQNKVARVYVYNGTSSTITNEIGQAGIHILYLRNFIK